jgi:hypothetical protein
MGMEGEAISAAADPLQGDRSGQRRRVIMIATLLTRDGAFKVRIRDISQVGAQVVGAAGIARGSDTLLKRQSLFAAARVVWSEGEEAGLKFYRKLTAEELADARIAIATPS